MLKAFLNQLEILLPTLLLLVGPLVFLAVRAEAVRTCCLTSARVYPL